MAKQKHYQYQLDINSLAGKPEEGWEKHTYDEGGSPLGLHDTNLFGENESVAGDLLDPYTGLPYDNSTYTGQEGLIEVNPLNRKSDNEDVLPPLKERKDDAAAWLAKHECVVAEVVQLLPIEEADAA